MSDNTTTKGGTLVGVEMMAREFATSHTANRMDKVAVIQILKSVLVRVVRVGTTIEIHGRRILPTFLVTCNNELKGLTW